MSKPGALAGRHVAVTGGAGFIGGHVVRGCRAQGASVRILDRRRAEPEGAEDEHRHVDLAEARAVDLARALEGATDVIHLAAEKHNRSGHDARLVYRTNVLGTHALFTAARLTGVARIVFASSVYAYGRTTGPAMTESEPSTPRTAYGQSKLAGEGMLRALCAESDVRGCSLRFFFVYGPGQDADTGYASLIPRTIARLRRGEPAEIFGDGNQSLDYVYVDDIVSAVSAALQVPLAGDVVNVASGTATPVRDVVSRLATAFGGPHDLIHAPADATAGTCRYADIGRARALLGWEPRVALDEGLARVIADEG